jgi:hypothetical protein
MAALSEGTLAALLRKAGFPEDKVPLMVNIAKRESGLRPDAHNPNAATGDNSYGLFQINMIGNLGPARLKEYADIGVTSYEDLKDPWKNVQAAKKVLDSQGLGAWTTYQAASKDPRPSLVGGDLSELMSATDPKAVAARGVDPLSAAFDSLFGAGTATQAAVAPVKDKAMGLDFVEQLREIDPGAAAQVAAVTALLPQRSAAAAEIASLAPVAGQAAPTAELGGGGFVARTGNSGISTGPHLDARWADGRPITAQALDRYLRIGGKNPSDWTMTSGYGPRQAPAAGASSFHKGVDLGIPAGTPIYTTGQAKLKHSLGEQGGAGYMVTVATPEGDLNLLHLTPGSSPLSRR